jgi:hypothetical protein
MISHQKAKETIPSLLEFIKQAFAAQEPVSPDAQGREEDVFAQIRRAQQLAQGRTDLRGKAVTPEVLSQIQKILVGTNSETPPRLSVGLTPQKADRFWLDEAASLPEPLSPSGQIPGVNERIMQERGGSGGSYQGSFSFCVRLTNRKESRHLKRFYRPRGAGAATGKLPTTSLKHYTRMLRRRTKAARAHASR